MVKKYEVIYDVFEGSIKVEIDHSLLKDSDLHLINDFWSNSENRLSDSDGNITEAVLKFLALVILSDSTFGQYNIAGCVNQFDYDAGYGYRGIEGWPKMDGSTGMKLTDVQFPEIDESAFEVKEHE